MEIDFKHISIYAGIRHDKSVIADARESFADLIYQHAAGVAALETARKIYNSDGPEEFSEKEIGIINSVKEYCTPMFIEALDSQQTQQPLNKK